MATHSSIRAWMRIPWTESLVATACGVTKGQTRLDNSREQARRHTHRQQDGKRNVALVKSLWDAPTFILPPGFEGAKGLHVGG